MAAKYINKFKKIGSAVDQPRSESPQTSTDKGTTDVMQAYIVPSVRRVLDTLHFTLVLLKVNTCTLFTKRKTYFLLLILSFRPSKFHNVILREKLLSSSQRMSVWQSFQKPITNCTNLSFPVTFFTQCNTM